MRGCKGHHPDMAYQVNHSPFFLYPMPEPSTENYFRTPQPLNREKRDFFDLGLTLALFTFFSFPCIIYHSYTVVILSAYRAHL